nr:MAG TPA: hypothetical protein [Caudoviricetes sp.]
MILLTLTKSLQEAHFKGGGLCAKKQGRRYMM